MSKTRKPADAPAAPQPAPRRSEAQGLLHFGREMSWALAMAFVFIVYVIQAFKIPTGSMENSLLIGDFLLGLKFIYGSPILPLQDKAGITTRFPGITDPKPGHVIIFRYPGADHKDYIKRCVAGPHQTVSVREKQLIVDSDTMVLPPLGQHVMQGMLMRHDQGRYQMVEGLHDRFGVKGRDTLRLAPQADTSAFDTLLHRWRRAVITAAGDTVDIPASGQALRDGRKLNVGEYVIDERLTYFAPLRIPAAGDTLRPSSLPLRELVYCRSLVRQENRHSTVTTEVQLWVDGEYANSVRFPWPTARPLVTVGDINWDVFDSWIDMDDALSMVRSAFAGHRVELRYGLFKDGKRLDRYVVKRDNYFMMGDNRDNSLDSRYWGYLNRTSVKAKAFILYFSWNSYRWCPRCHTYRAPDGHFYDPNGNEWRCRRCGEALSRSVPPWMKIRWNRIGKLIRAWNVTSGGKRV